MARHKQSVGLNFDSKCNARCSHCCVNSSPQSTDHLSDDVVDKMLADALSHPDVAEVGLTGGEALLRKERTIQLIRTITNAGRTATLVTNGFWGVTLRAASRMLADLEEAGLRSMSLSFDDFHAPYVSVQRIKNVLEASRASSIQVILNMAVSRNNTANGLLESLGTSTYCIPVTRFPILPAGQAAALDSDEFVREPISKHNTRCPGLEIILHHDGKVYPCCSPAVFDTPLTLGNVGDDSIEELIAKVERNAVLAILQREGLEWFRDKIATHFPDAPAVTATEIVSACELCALIFGDPKYVRSIRSEITAYITAEPMSVQV